uniref:G-protein coupled receptors family 1 profile domain-containing protein n=1 Tax=Phocoena sinus TaxID=42100 RepID=A0A8C9CA70_PHOSS
MTTNTSSDQSSFLGNHGLHCSMYLLSFLTGLPLKLEALVILVDKLQRCPAAVRLLFLNLTLSAASGTRWPLPFIFCPFSRFLFFTTVYLPSLFLAAVSDERFLSVAYPVWYQSRPRPGQAGLVSGACWLLAAAHRSVVYVTELSGRSSPTQAGGTRYLEFRKDQLAFLLPVQLEMAVVLFGVPLLLTSYCYSRPVCILGKGASQRRRKRVVGSQQPCCSTFSSGESPKWRSSVLPLNTLNSCVDTLYYFSSSGFQADFQGLLGRRPGACGPWWQEGSVTLKSEGEGPPQELSNIRGGSGDSRNEGAPCCDMCSSSRFPLFSKFRLSGTFMKNDRRKIT